MIDPRGGSVSHRQAGVKRSAVAGLLRHNFRDIDLANGVVTSHSNERIRPERTGNNETWMWIDGVMLRPERTEDIEAELDRRLEGACSSIRRPSTRKDKKTGKVTKVKGGRVALKANAAVVRDIVLQLDPAITGTVDDPLMTADEVREAIAEMVAHYADLYGLENLLALSIHWDETSPHAHLLLTPIDEDKRVRNASFIADGRGANSGMARNDRAMRRRMIEAGYNVSPEPTGSARGHMSVETYARHAGWVQEVVEREAEAQAEEERLTTDREQVRQRAAKVRNDDARARRTLAEDRKALDEREAAVKAAEGRLGRWRAGLRGTAAVLEGRLDAVGTLYEELRATQDELVAAREQLTPAGRSQVAGAIRSLNDLGARLEALTAHVVEVPESPDDPTL